MFWVLFAPIIRSTTAVYSHRLFMVLVCYSIGAGTGLGHPCTQAWSDWSKYWFGTPLHLTLYRRATQICVIAIPCIVDGSRIFAFSYTSSCTCVWHLVWLTYRFKFIISMMQDVGSHVTNRRTSPDPLFIEL
jgi:hypothetical protein